MEPVRGGTGGSIIGPRNLPLEAENPDLLAPPETDAGTIPNLRYSFAAAHNRLLTGGRAREVLRRRQLLRERDLPDHRLVQAHPAGDACQELRCPGGHVRGHPAGRRPPLRFPELFRSDRFANISLKQWMALTPPELVQAPLNLDAATRGRAVQGQARGRRGRAVATASAVATAGIAHRRLSQTAVRDVLLAGLTFGGRGRVPRAGQGLTAFQTGNLVFLSIGIGIVDGGGADVLRVGCSIGAFAAGLVAGTRAVGSSERSTALRD